MTNLEILMRAILDEPDAELHRLAYADALEESGNDALAAEVRVPLDQADSTEQHESKLLGKDERLFLIRRRGFFDEVRCTTATWKKHGPRLVREHPLTVVRLTDHRPYHEYSPNPLWHRETAVNDALYADSPTLLPGWLWPFLRPVPDAIDFARYETADEAYAALSHACLGWARSRR